MKATFFHPGFWQLDISPEAKVVFGYIASRTKEQLQRAGRNTLIKDLGMDKRDIVKAMNELKAKGMVEFDNHKIPEKSVHKFWSFEALPQQEWILTAKEQAHFNRISGTSPDEDVIEGPSRKPMIRAGASCAPGVTGGLALSNIYKEEENLEKQEEETEHQSPSCSSNVSPISTLSLELNQALGGEPATFKDILNIWIAEDPTNLYKRLNNAYSWDEIGNLIASCVEAGVPENKVSTSVFLSTIDKLYKAIQQNKKGWRDTIEVRFDIMKAKGYPKASIVQHTFNLPAEKPKGQDKEKKLSAKELIAQQQAEIDALLESGDVIGWDE